MKQPRVVVVGSVNVDLVIRVPRLPSPLPDAEHNHRCPREKKWEPFYSDFDDSWRIADK